MTSLTKFPMPRGGTGVVAWEALLPYLETYTREILARMDPRNAQSDFPTGLLANLDGTVTLGTGAIPTGRTVSVATLTDKIDDVGRAEDQRFMWPVTVANRNSVQSVDTVLTATSDATASEISVASHNVKFDFGSVTYGSGTISGLTSETVYYVYTDDPDLDGAVAPTYYATTNPDNLIAKGRYYVGYVNTPVLATSGTINAATSASPIEFTTAADHGWSTGDTVEFASLPGDFGTNLNGNEYAITVTDTDKFTIAVDGSGYAAYTNGGTATRVSTPLESGGGAGGGVGGGRFDYTWNIP